MGRTTRKTIEECISNLTKVHGSRYDYTKVHYVNSVTKICVQCKIHGDFWQTTKNHLKGLNLEPKIKNN